MKNKRKFNCNVSSSRPKKHSQTPQSQCGNIVSMPHMDVTSRHVSTMYGFQLMMPIG
ncbi:hypothetical protein RYX36_009142 [Vicia faba]